MKKYHNKHEKPSVAAFVFGLFILLTGLAITAAGWVYTRDGFGVIEGFQARLFGVLMMIAGASLAGNYLVKKFRSGDGDRR